MLANTSLVIFFRNLWLTTTAIVLHVVRQIVVSTNSFTVEKMHDIRSEHMNAVTWISGCSSATKHFALCPWDSSMLIRRCPFGKDPFPFSTPDTSDFEWQVFTDGSAHFPTHWDCTCAGGAFVACYDLNVDVVHQLARPLPGLDHSSFRAEVFSILLAFNGSMENATSLRL